MPTYVLLFSVATAVAILVRPLRIPYTVALVFAGLGLGALPGFAAPQLTRDLLFAVFLPGLLFEAAFHLSAREFWRNRLAILSLAVPGVLASMALIALVLVPAGVFATAGERGIGTAVVFAALIAATD